MHFYYFLKFYATFDNFSYGIAIDLSELFPEEGFKPNFPKKFKLTEPVYPTKQNYESRPILYLRDPIGKIYYSDPSERHLYRENAAEGAWDYDRFKSEVIKTFTSFEASRFPSFKKLMMDVRCYETFSNYDTDD